MCCPTEIMSLLWHLEITLDLQKSWSWGSNRSLSDKLQGLPPYVPKPVKVSRNWVLSSDTLMNNNRMNFSKKEASLPIIDCEDSPQFDSPWPISSNWFNLYSPKMGVFLRSKCYLLAGVSKTPTIYLQRSMELGPTRQPSGPICMTEERCDPILWALKQSYRS